VNAAARRLVLTRGAEASRPWQRRLESAGIPCLVVPLLRFTPLPVPDHVRHRRFDWIMFTSPQAVRAFAAAELSAGDARIASLGKGTTGALHQIGLSASLESWEQDGAGLARVFCTQLEASVSVLLPGPLRRLAEPRATLERAGHRVTELPLYRTDPVPPEELPADPWREGDVVLFASPSAVRAFVAAWRQRPPCVAIGATTAAACREHGFPTRVAARPDLEHLVQAAGLDASTLTPTPES